MGRWFLDRLPDKLFWGNLKWSLRLSNSRFIRRWDILGEKCLEMLLERVKIIFQVELGVGNNLEFDDRNFTEFYEYLLFILQ